MTGVRALSVPVAVAAVVAVLLVAGRGALAPPSSLADVGEWLESRGTVTAAFAILRVLALVAATWVLVVSSVATAARLAGAARLAFAAERALPTVLRRSLAGIGVASVIAAGGPAGAQTAPGGDGTATMSVLDDDDPTTPTTTTAVPSPAPAPAPAPVAPAAWVVAPGDSFWSIAEDAVADAVGRPASDPEVDRYWRVLIAANRDRLVSPNPDLLHTGQVLVLPPVSSGA